MRLLESLCFLNLLHALQHVYELVHRLSVLYERRFAVLFAQLYLLNHRFLHLVHQLFKLLHLLRLLDLVLNGVLWEDVQNLLLFEYDVVHSRILQLVGLMILFNSIEIYKRNVTT